MGTNHISGMADRFRCCQLRWTVSVVNWWRSRSPVYHTDSRHLCTTRTWASGTASRGSVSGSGDLCPLLDRPFCERSILCFAHVSFLADVNSRSRSLYTMADPSVCLSSVICLSVTLVRPTQAVELFGNFCHHTIAQGLYFSGAKNRWWGTPPSPWNLRSKWPTPFQTAQFWPISAHSVSTLIASEKSSITTYRKSTMRFPTSYR